MDERKKNVEIFTPWDILFAKLVAYFSSFSLKPYFCFILPNDFPFMTQ
jgi:hypothetical protein